MEFAAKIRQRLCVARFRPERTRNPLTRDRGVAAVKNEESNELLLSGARRAINGTPVGEKTKAAQKLDAETRRHHGPRLHRSD
jgi:hypothetical protein